MLAINIACLCCLNIFKKMAHVRMHACTYTHIFMQQLLVKNRGTVPLCIVRPSIVTAALREPEPGWIDAVSAAAAVVLSALLGILKFMPGSPDVVADIVPVDFVVNTILAAIPAVMNQVCEMCLLYRETQRVRS